MGNRAVITTAKATNNSIGIYLHWNGGLESVLAFLECAKRLGMRNPNSDPSYGWARLAQVIGNFFGGSCSLGIGTLGMLDCDNGDNGTFYFDKDWDIVGRKHTAHADKLHVADLDEREKAQYEGIIENIMAQYAKGEFGEYKLKTPESTPTAN